MKEYYLNCSVQTTENHDLTPLFVGSEQCESGHTFGPYMRSCFLIHFCIAGKGKLVDKFGTHSVSAGELFVIRPGEITTYMADASDPWEYCWVGFLGARASIFKTDRSIYPIPATYGSRLYDAIKTCEDSAECYLAFLYELIYKLFCKHKAVVSQDNRIAGARQYIDYHYMRRLRVGDLAREFGFERSYLYRLFRKQYGIGVKEYITKVRMEHARELLNAGHRVGQVAFMVGYEDLFHFSKSYKSYFGETPSKRM